MTQLTTTYPPDAPLVLDGGSGKPKPYLLTATVRDCGRGTVIWVTGRLEDGFGIPLNQYLGRSVENLLVELGDEPDRELVAALLFAEERGKNRSTLVEALAELL
ncbi:MAG: hypothetical protein AAFZ07_19620 [Actinomycetota bacterium]